MFGKKVFIIKLVLSILLMSGYLYANTSPIPSVIHYQAQLKGLDGINIDKAVDIQMWIYSSATDGVLGDLNSKLLLYAEKHDAVKIDRGMLRLSIGEGVGIGKFSGKSFSVDEFAKVQDLFLQLVVDGEEIKPRQKIGYQNSSLKAEYAKVAENVNGELSISSSEMPNVDANQIKGDVPLARIPTDMDVTKISGQISIEQVPTLSLDKIASGTLNPSVVGGIDKGIVVNAEWDEAAKMNVKKIFPASVVENAMSGNDYFVISGVYTTASSIPLPATYTEKQCAVHVGLMSVDTSLVPNGQYVNELFISANYQSGNYTMNCQFGYLNGIKGAAKCGYLMFCIK